MRNKLTSLTIAALLVGTFVLAIAPTAEAQGSTSLVVKLDPATEKVKPLQGQIAIRGTATFTADGVAMSSLIGIPISYTVKNAPAWASVTVSPSSDVITLDGTPSQSVSKSVTFDVIVSASEQAPAFQSAPIEIQATTTAPNSAIKSATAAGSTPIQADYFSIIDVNLAEAIKIDRPQTAVIFPVTITNFGNANTKVSFEVLEKTENLELLIPNPITLQSKQAGGNQISNTVQLTIQTPYKNGYMNEVGSVTYKLTSAYALDPKLKGDESTVAVLVTTKGFYVPGFSPLLLVGILIVAAAVFRRRL